MELNRNGGNVIPCEKHSHPTCSVHVVIMVWRETKDIQGIGGMKMCLLQTQNTWVLIINKGLHFREPSMETIDISLQHVHDVISEMSYYGTFMSDHFLNVFPLDVDVCVCERERERQSVAGWGAVSPSCQMHMCTQRSTRYTHSKNNTPMKHRDSHISKKI
jgi:hypothetical protein